MIPELGHFALILSLVVASCLGVLALVWSHQNRPEWIAFARPGAQALWLLLAFSFG